MARETTKSLKAELAREQAKVVHLRGKITALQAAFQELMAGIFVTEEEAAEIARDAVSERIW